MFCVANIGEGGANEFLVYFSLFPGGQKGLLKHL